MNGIYAKPGVHQRLAKHLRISNADGLQLELNSLAAQGYRYLSIKPVFSISRGGWMAPSKGAHVDSLILAMEPCAPGSLYRVSIIKRGKGTVSGGIGEMDDELQAVSQVQAWAGYVLVDVLNLDSFGIEKPGPGTAGLLCIFERPVNSTHSLTLDQYSLKSERKVDTDFVICPVLGCTEAVPRMRQKGDNLDSKAEDLQAYKCPKHRIYISPSTYQYENPYQSILWHDDADIEALHTLTRCPGGKRTWARMGRERDEDSLTWNVFRGLHREDVIANVLDNLIPSHLTLTGSKGCKLIFWSVDLENGSVWEPLKQARQALGERAPSEPDVVIVRDYDVLLVEVKFTSIAKTPKAILPDNYVQEPRWSRVFCQDPAEVLQSCGYELTRYHLLASALEETSAKPCHVVSLVMDGHEQSLRDSVTPSLVNAGCYHVLSWGQLEKQIKPSSVRLSELKRYLKAKTAGYDSKGKIEKLIR